MLLVKAHLSFSQLGWGLQLIVKPTLDREEMSFPMARMQTQPDPGKVKAFLQCLKMLTLTWLHL